jgi:hypothetical protein
MTTPSKRPPMGFTEMAALVQSGLDHGAVACESCDADLALVDTGGNVYVLEVRHDDTCPFLLARYEKDES